MTTFQKEQIINLLEISYDYYSARTIYQNCCDKFKLDPSDVHNANSLKLIAEELKSHKKNNDAVIIKIAHLLDIDPSQLLQHPDTTKKAQANFVDSKPVEIQVEEKSQSTKPQPAQILTLDEPQKFESKLEQPQNIETIDPQQTIILSITADFNPDTHQLFISGASENLGQWNPEKAIEALFDDDDKKWFAEITLSKQETTEAKLFVIDASNNILWESGENHSLTNDLNLIEITWNDQPAE